MALTINTNLSAIAAQRSQTSSQSDLSTAIARLSSGLRINSAKDDAAGLAIAARFTAQLRGTAQAGRNANDGISLAQTADGALASIDDNLQRMRELSVQAANATNSSSDRASLQLEVAQLRSEIDRVATQTQFNGVNLLDGSFTSQSFQVGANAGQAITVGSIPSVRTAALGTRRGVVVQGVSQFFAAGTLQNVNIQVGAAPLLSLGPVAADAKAVVAAINTANIAGLTATVNANNVAAGVSAAAASSSGTASLTLNGVVIALAGTTGAAALAGNRSSAVSAINAQSAATGVVATDTGSGVGLTAADGRNITTSYAAGGFVGSSAADFGLAAPGATAGTFAFDYTAAPGVAVMSLGFSDVPITSASSITSFVSTVGTPVSAVDISSPGGANTALTAIDAALKTVSAARASLGAVQNRFGSTIENLQSAGENLAASRGRIQDADFAAETASLSRAQVLQRSGTAMIAQANQLPSQVLALLR